jgi:hypothetical protein
VHAIERAMHDDIETVNWMTPATKERAIVKLKGIEDKVGYPSHWRDYSRVKVTRDSYLADAEQASAFEFEQLGRQGWQASGPQRVGHDAAYHQCVLQYAIENDQLSRRHSAASVFREEHG